MIRTLRQAVISSRKGHPIGGGCHSPWRTCGSLAFLAFSTTASTMFHHQPLHFRSTLWPRIQGADALKGREAVQLDASSSICHHFTTDAAGDMKSPFVHEDPKITEVEANKFGIDGTKYRLEVHSYPNTSLNPQAVIAPREGAEAVVLIMHGLGDTCDGWLAPTLHEYLPALHDKVKYILPSAPNQPVTLNMGMTMPSWYDIKSLDEDRANQSCDGIENSRKHIEWLLQKEIDGGIPTKNIVIGGFSQGGALALYTGLQQSSTYAGILVKSGYLPDVGNVTVTEAAKDTPIHFFHGIDDPMVKHQWGFETAEKVRELGCKNVQFRDYEGLEHGANEEELHDVAAWLQQVIPPGL